MHDEPAFRGDSDSQVAAVQADPLAHTHQAVTADIPPRHIPPLPSSRTSMSRTVGP